MLGQNTVKPISSEHAKLITAAESFDSRRFSVARKLMHGSDAVDNETLKMLTEETSKAINNLRAFEQSQIPPVNPHLMPNWANFYGDEKARMDGRKRRG